MMTVAEVKRKGVLVQLAPGDPPVSIGQTFSIYHVVGGVQTSLGQGVVWKLRGPTMFKLNPNPGTTFNNPQVGDTVQ